MSALRTGSFALQLLIATMLGACAGGGGGGGAGSVVLPPVGPPPPPPPAMPPVPPLPPVAPASAYPNLSSNEFTNDWGPSGIHAQAAWQFENAHGEGVLIGVIDDGIVAPSDPNYAELAGRVSPDSTDINTARNQLSSTLSHGSELSALMVGNFNGQSTVGVAYEAQVLAVRSDNGADGFSYGDLANAVNYAVAHGVDIINFSLGSLAFPSSSDAQAFRDALANATAHGVIIVSSAGNEGPSAPNIFYPGYFATDPSVSHGLIIAAGGLNSDGTFNTISNPAGAAANWYVTAPGWQIVVPDFGPTGPVPGFQVCYPNPSNCTGLVQIQGTSYASPHVSAAAALLMSAFPGLTPQQVVDILLASTIDTGAVGVDPQTGRGRLDLNRAFAPFGTVSSPLAAGMPAATASTVLGMAGSAFGDGLNNPSNWATVGFDRYGRTFQINLAGNWLRAPGGPSLGGGAPTLWRTSRAEGGATMQFAPADDVAPQSLRLPLAREDIEQPAVRIDSHLGYGFDLSFAAHGARTTYESAETAGHMAFVNADYALRLSHKLTNHVGLAFLSQSGEAEVGLQRDRVIRSATGAQAQFQFGRLSLDANFGRISESEGLLGLVWTDALGDTPRGEIRFAGVSGRYDVNRAWRLNFELEQGEAGLAQNGWLRVAAPLRTSAFAAEIDYFGASHWIAPFGASGTGVLALTLSQPMRVEDGALLVDLPTATRYGRESLSYETRTIDPAPSGRELRFGVGYRYFEGERVSAFGEVLRVLDPGHVAGAEDETVLRLGLRVRR
ncbi:MAG TPA: S8 family peptidase [Caulobacterales bacterium]|nr:S8 family peptidase [Caulobacterales bacterium]